MKYLHILTTIATGVMKHHVTYQYTQKTLGNPPNIISMSLLKLLTPTQKKTFFFKSSKKILITKWKRFVIFVLLLLSPHEVIATNSVWIELVLIDLP